jgi:hypothetical protein
MEEKYRQERETQEIRERQFNEQKERESRDQRERESRDQRDSELRDQSQRDLLDQRERELRNQREAELRDQRERLSRDQREREFREQQERESRDQRELENQEKVQREIETRKIEFVNSKAGQKKIGNTKTAQKLVNAKPVAKKISPDHSRISCTPSIPQTPDLAHNSSTSTLSLNETEENSESLHTYSETYLLPPILSIPELKNFKYNPANFRFISSSNLNKILTELTHEIDDEWVPTIPSHKEIGWIITKIAGKLPPSQFSALARFLMRFVDAYDKKIPL